MKTVKEEMIPTPSGYRGTASQLILEGSIILILKATDISSKENYRLNILHEHRWKDRSASSPLLSGSHPQPLRKGIPGAEDSAQPSGVFFPSPAVCHFHYHGTFLLGSPCGTDCTQVRGPGSHIWACTPKERPEGRCGRGGAGIPNSQEKGT